MTPLLIATKKRYVDIVKELLQANAQLDIAGLLKLKPGAGMRRMNPFLCSLLQGYPEIARMLIKCGHNLTGDKYLWTNENVPEYLTLDVEFWLWLQELISQPITLMETVKIYLRKYMGYNITRTMTHLNLPAALKKYVLCADLEIEN